MDAAQAIANAVRILQAIEGETDLHLMERMTALVDCWLRTAELLSEREHA